MDLSIVFECYTLARMGGVRTTNSATKVPAVVHRAMGDMAETAREEDFIENGALFYGRVPGTLTAPADNLLDWILEDYVSEIRIGHLGLYKIGIPAGQVNHWSVIATDIAYPVLEMVNLGLGLDVLEGYTRMDEGRFEILVAGPLRATANFSYEIRIGSI